MKALLRRLAARPSAPNAAADGLMRRYVERVIELVPELAQLAPPRNLGAGQLDAALEALELLVPQYHTAARETQRRNVITRLLPFASDPDVHRSLTLELAASNLKAGVLDRAVMLMRKAGVELGAEIETEVTAFEHEYGARAGLITNLDRWLALEGDVRGRSLLAVLEDRREELVSRSVIHVSPEATTKSWFLDNADGLRGEYRTLDPFDPSVDLQEDLTALSLPSESADYILCHRVLEHVLDDRAAMNEMHRILRPGGILNVSVPMGTQMAHTNDWVIRDHSHDGHVRHYGRDLDRRLCDAGFAVEVDQTLLRRELDEHIARTTYPMRIYICSR